MQPNQPQGYYRPDQAQPTDQPVTMPQGQVVQPVGGSIDPSPTQAPQDAGSVVGQDLSAQVGAATVGVNDQAVAGGDETYDNYSDDSDETQDEAALAGPVSWTAHEYLHQEKGAGWFILFAIVIAGLIGLSIWMNAISFTAVLVVITFIVVVYLRRPPRELSYTLNDEGLLIDNHLYKYEDFKAFGVVQDGDEFSVMLIPTQRFQPSVTVYFPEEAGEDIVDMLGSRLPMKNLKLDAVDRLVRLLRL